MLVPDVWDLAYIVTLIIVIIGLYLIDKYSYPPATIQILAGFGAAVVLYSIIHRKNRYVNARKLEK